MLSFDLISNVMSAIDNKITEKLEEYGFSLEDLTPEELNALKEEIEVESKGMIILDGVLFHKDKYK